MLTLLFFHPFLSGKNILSFRDLSLYFYPLRHLMVDMVRAGQLPLWNPYMLCGYPLLGTLQACFFYPLSLVLYLLPFSLAFNYYSILHYFLAAVFMYWLMRHYKLSRSSSFLAGTIFAFSGYSLSMANMNTTLSSFIWAPLLLLFYDRIISSGVRFTKDWLILGILFCIQFLGGEPTIIYLTALFLLAYGVVESRRSLIPALKNAAVLVPALALAAGLAAVQLFPFMETAVHSLRLLKTDYLFISFKAFPPRELINFVLPFFFGSLIRDGSFLPLLLGDKFQAWILSPYIGFFPLLFAFLSLRKGMDRRIILLWAAVIFSFLMAFARFTPVYGFFFKFLPGISFIRYPAKYIFLAVFSLSMLCGFGYESALALIEKKKSGVNWVITFLLSSLVLVGLLHLWSSANLENIFFHLKRYLPSFLGPYHMGGLWRILTFDVQSLSNLFIYLLLGISFFTMARKGLSREIFGFLVISLIIFDFFSVNSSINIPGEHRVFENVTPNIRILKEDKGAFRYFSIPSRRVDLDAASRTYDENLLHDKDNLSPNWLVPYRIAHLGGRESMEQRGFSRLYWPVAERLAEDHGRLLDMANVKYIFALKDIDRPNLKLLRKKEMGEITGNLYLNSSCYPRAYFVKSVRVEKDRDKIIEKLLGADFDPRNEVVLEEELKYEWKPSFSREGVEVLSHEPNRVMIRTFSDKPRVMFLSDTYYPGWKAYVDGKETRIYRANYMFRAVKLGPGKHEVRFVYSPLSFKLGSIISLFSLVLVAVLFFRVTK